MSSTIAISDHAHSVYKAWKTKTGMTSIEFFDKLVKAVVMRKREVLYDSLPDPRGIKGKPLSGKKIHKNYRKNSYN